MTADGDDPEESLLFPPPHPATDRIITDSATSNAARGAASVIVDMVLDIAIRYGRQAVMITLLLSPPQRSFAIGRYLIYP
jgi:hypothetical protein